MITMTCSKCGSKKEINTPGIVDLRCQEKGCSGGNISFDVTVVRTLAEDSSVRERISAGREVPPTAKLGTVSTGLWTVSEIRRTHLQPGDSDYVEEKPFVPTPPPPQEEVVEEKPVRPLARSRRR